MTDLTIAQQLAQLDQAIAAQAALRGIMPDETIDATIKSLQQQKAALQAAITAGGDVVGHDKAGGDIVGRDKTSLIYIGQLILGHSPTNEREKAIAAATQAYLRRLRDWCNDLPLVTIGWQESEKPPSLEQIYIELDTTTLLEEEKDERRFSGREPRRLPALAAATQHERLALLGDPGSGKSSFAQRLTGWLARAALQECEPPPDWPPLLPLFVRLRDLAPALNKLTLPASRLRQEELLADLLLAHWQESLPAVLREAIVDWLAEGRAFLVFDGLDELPEAPRPLAIAAVQAVLKRYPDCRRVLLTCRIRSYGGRNQMLRLPPGNVGPV
jgi:hypothetical protein